MDVVEKVKDWSEIDKAVTVSITFEFQKKEIRNDTISHQRSDGCNLTVTVLGSQLSGICLDHRIGGSSLLVMVR